MLYVLLLLKVIGVFIVMMAISPAKVLGFQLGWMVKRVAETVTWLGSFWLLS